MELNDKIYVAGHNGLVGSAIIRNLQKKGYSNILTESFSNLDLRRQTDVEDFFRDNKPDYVILAAAKVGGIFANNKYPAEFIYDNVMIESNIIHSAHLHSTKKLLFLGSSCIYPKFAEQPMKEEYLLSGYLEETNEAYAISKITGIELCKFYRKQYNDDFISVMPTNLYGINDNFNLETSHVLPALIRKIHDAKMNGDSNYVIWGSGSPRREFLFVDDLADACVFLMNNYSEEEHINIGTGEDITILELAKLVAVVANFEGSIEKDLSKPDGTPRKLLDVTKLHNFGWKHKTNLFEGISIVYNWYLENENKEPIK